MRAQMSMFTKRAEHLDLLLLGDRRVVEDVVDGRELVGRPLGVRHSGAEEDRSSK